MDCFFPLSSSFGVCLFPLFVLYFCLLILPNSLGFFYAASRPVMAPGLGEVALCRRRPVFLVFHLFPLCLLVFSMLLMPVLVSSWPISTLSLLVTRTICSRAAPMWAACTLLLRHSQILWAASSTDPPWLHWLPGPTWCGSCWPAAGWVWVPAWLTLVFLN